jgi:hypothetical protein
LGGNLYATTPWPTSIGTGEGGADPSPGIGLTQNPHLKPEWRKALRLLARSPRGATEDLLELAHGFCRDTLAMLTRVGFATLVTETLKVEGGTFTVERLRITDAGRRAIRVDRT